MLRVACPALILALTASCALPNETIEGADRGTLFTGLRSSWVLDEQVPRGDRTGAVRMLLDLEWFGSSSGFTQRLSAGQAIAVGSTQFVGPGDVDVDFDLERLSADLRASARAASGLGVEGFAGLGYHELDLRAASLTRGDRESFRGVGPLLGLGCFYEPADGVRLFVEASVNPTLTTGAQDFIDFNTLEVGARLRLGERVGLSIAWREVNYRAANDVFSSNLDLTAAGPAVTLSLSW